MQNMLSCGDLLTIGTLVWDDHSIGISDVALNATSNSDARDCAAYGLSGLVDMYDCNSRHSFVCKQSKSPPARQHSSCCFKSRLQTAIICQCGSLKRQVFCGGLRRRAWSCTELQPGLHAARCCLLRLRARRQHHLPPGRGYVRA